MSQSGNSKVTVAVSGCGAITELMYVPALKLLERLGMVSLKAHFDPSAERRAAVTKHFPEAKGVSEFGDVLKSGAELLIVASPAALHAQQSIAASRAGMHVLCEKPMASSLAAAEQMVAAAGGSGKQLFVGHFRRFFPALSAIREMLQAQTLGAAQRFHCTEGSNFNWAAQSPSFFRKDLAGGGVLIDTGPHVLDIVGWLFGVPSVVSYFDDAAGGVEANCRIELKYDALSGVVRMSRDFELPNRYMIYCEKGVITWRAGETTCIEVQPRGSKFVQRIGVETLHPSGQRIPGATYSEAFGLQLMSVVGALRGQVSSAVSGDEALSTARLIERCYKTRQPLEGSWNAYPVAPQSTPFKRCAVLGAGGFVGARLIEALVNDARYRLHPIVRKYASLARFARFELDWRLADAGSATQLEDGFRDCDVVVHCAAVNPAEMHTTFEPVYRAAERAGVQRIVYLSSASVHGQNPVEGCDERSPLSDRQEIDYNNAKVRAEWELLRLRNSGKVELVMLRPGIVYGPRSRWMLETARALWSGSAYLVGGGAGVFNGIYIDNLVHAIDVAIHAEARQCDREAFLLGEDGSYQWRDFVIGICRGLGFDPSFIFDAPSAPEVRPNWKHHVDSVRSSSIAKKVLPLFPARSKQAVKAALAAWSAPERQHEWKLPQAVPPCATREMTLLHQCRWKLPYNKASQALKYQPLLGFDEGMQRSIDWLKEAGFGNG